MTPSETYWNGEPCEARIVRVIVADGSFPNYWARPYVGDEREAVEVTYAGRTFYLDNEAHTPQGAELEVLQRFGKSAESSPAGEGWRKVTEHRGSPRAPHRSLDVERVLEPSLRPDDSPPGAAMYRKRPIVIEARQTGRDYDTDCEIVGWCGGCAVGPEDGYDTAIIVIDTLEGKMAVEPGDWVIRGVKGEFYPCKPDIFEATYEPVGASQENLRPAEQSQVSGEKVGTYRPWDREEKLGPPPWKPDDPKLIAWEKAHGHDVRLKCYPEFGCQLLEEQAARHERGNG